jgi:hypothetical protein
MRNLRLLSALLIALFGSTASAKDLNLARTAKSGVVSPLAYSGAWDRNCNSLATTVTIVTPPANGAISVIDAEEVLPAATPGSGSTGNCEGKTIKAKRVMYLSKPNFHGTDTVVYDSKYPNGVNHTTIAITVQ